MAVTPESILESAAAMSQGGAEVDWRNANSRARYAAYHRCRALATLIDPQADLSTARVPSFRCRHPPAKRQPKRGTTAGLPTRRIAESQKPRGLRDR